MAWIQLDDGRLAEDNGTGQYPLAITGGGVLIAVMPNDPPPEHGRWAKPEDFAAVIDKWNEQNLEEQRELPDFCKPAASHES